MESGYELVELSSYQGKLGIGKFRLFPDWVQYFCICSKHADRERHATQSKGQSNRGDRGSNVLLISLPGAFTFWFLY